MLLWFLGAGIATVWFVFRDPRFDYRVLALGLLLPDVVDGLTGGSSVLHSLAGSVGLMVVVMVATVGRRAARRRWLALPIGTFLHLVFDGAFANAEAFWWPFTGLGFGDEPLPVVARGWWNVPLELAGLAVLVIGGRRLGLRRPAVRSSFVRTGQLAAPQGGAATC